MEFDKKYNNQYYDQMYKTSLNYKNHYKDSVFFPIYEYVKNRLDLIKNPNILEIGCGVGDCAHYIYDNGYRNYKGFDFSEYAIEICKNKVPLEFYVSSAYEPKNYKNDYNVIIITEVLEHIENDLDVISLIRNNTTILGSVPFRGGAGHCRFFKNIEEVKERYKDIKINNFKYIFRKNGELKWILFEGKK